MSDSPVPPQPAIDGSPPDDPEALRREIEHTREELGETVAALSDKADVRAQASAKAEEVKEEVKERAEEVTGAAKARAESVADQARENPVPFVIGGVVLLLLLNRVRKRRKARRRERGLLEDALQHSLASGVPVAAVLVDRPRPPAT